MKTILITITLAVLAINTRANETYLKYVCTDTDTIVCEKISVGGFNIAYKDMSGEKHKISLNDVSEYGYEGNTYIKQAVYKYNEPTSKTQFMQLIGYYKGVDILLYKTVNSYNKYPVKMIGIYYNGKWIKNFENYKPSDIFSYIDTLKLNNNSMLTNK